MRDFLSLREFMGDRVGDLGVSHELFGCLEGLGDWGRLGFFLIVPIFSS